MSKQNLSLVYTYITAVILVTLPFWALGSFTHIDGLPFNMQLNVLLIFAFPIITSLFVYKANGVNEVKRMWKACLPMTANRTILIALICMPLAALVTFVILQSNSIAFDGFSIKLLSVPLYFLLYYIASAFEEIGWTWFMAPILHKEYIIGVTGLIIGIVWSFIHTLPWYLQSGIYFMWGMVTLSVLNRVVMIWLYLRLGAPLWVVIVYHAMINTTLMVFHTGSLFANPFLYSFTIAAIVIYIVVFDSFRTRVHRNLH